MILLILNLNLYNRVQTVLKYFHLFAGDDDPRKIRFECDICHKFLTERGALLTHKRIHMGWYTNQRQMNENIPFNFQMTRKKGFHLNATNVGSDSHSPLISKDIRYSITPVCTLS